MTDRDWTTEQLESLGFNVLPSSTNFVFTSHKKLSGAELMQHLRDQNILVRHFTKPGIENFLRITIGTREEMQAMVDVLKTHPELS